MSNSAPSSTATATSYTRSSARRAVAGAAVAMVALILGAACSPAQPDDRVTVRFDSQSIDSTLNPQNSGTSQAGTTTEMVVANGGTLTGIQSLESQGSRAEYPAHDPDKNSGPRALIRITNNGSVDLLNPGIAPFTFGADINLDDPNSTSAAVLPNTADDGNNVFQRGLYNEAAQFKLEVDGNRPLCRVKGDLGAVDVTGDALTPGDDYRIRCSRDGVNLTLTVTELDIDGSTGAADTFVNASPTGNLTYPVTMPLTIGGKVWSGSGNIALSATDQFNGTIDNAILRIGG